MDIECCCFFVKEYNVWHKQFAQYCILLDQSSSRCFIHISDNVYYEINSFIK